MAAITSAANSTGNPRVSKPIIKPNAGFVHLGFQNLNDNDFKMILSKMATPSRRERRPRKCRRLNRIGEILARLPKKVVYFNLAGNEKIGDAGMEHLHLLPDSVEDFDLSSCGLTPLGIKRVCDFMKTNTSVTRLIMWGNQVGTKGAEYIGDMLSVNKTLRILCIMETVLTVESFDHISRGLANNDSLRTIDLGNDDMVGDEHVKRICPGLKVNRGLETLDLCGASISDRGLPPIEEALRENYSLKNIRLNQPVNEEDHIRSGPDTIWRKICLWLTLNDLGRNLILREDKVTVQEWQEALLRCHCAKNLNAIFYFLRNKPDHLTA